jgi:hypothetical protein
MGYKKSVGVVGVVTLLYSFLKIKNKNGSGVVVTGNKLYNPYNPCRLSGQVKVGSRSWCHHRPEYT